MTHRFFHSGAVSLGEMTLEGPEAKHLAAVMRAKPGDAITLFNGGGSEFTAVIEAIQKRAVTVRITEELAINRELPNELTLCAATPKGDRQKWLVEKATELGVTKLILLQTERSVVKTKEKSVERHERNVIEASKQCGRNRCMQVDIADLSDVLNAPPENAQRLFGEPAGETKFLSKLAVDQPVWVVVGPEGGLSPAEEQQLRDHGWLGVSVGSRILRIETAALALAAVCAAKMAAGG
ncbi:MAG: 16S rRNA (uracil(1498)-N(3))-methyltransferase [bacterium]|nr:16S rRNA (uracil(1498)-N(3))-methyltransferase [bacterium]